MARPKDYKICPHCGSRLPQYPSFRYDWNDERELIFSGKSEKYEPKDDDWYIWECKDNKPQGKPKRGRWSDREKLFLGDKD